MTRFRDKHRFFRVTLTQVVEQFRQKHARVCFDDFWTNLLDIKKEAAQNLFQIYFVIMRNN